MVGGTKRWFLHFALSAVVLLLSLAGTPTAYAIPYNGEQAYTYHQPDGSTFEVKLYGSEFFAYQRTLDGQEVIRDAKTGFYCYATLAADGRSFVSTGVPVVTTSSPSPAAGLTRASAAGVAAPGQVLPTDVVMARVSASQAEHRVDQKGIPLPPPASASASKSTPAVQPGPPSRTTVGNYVGLCILVDFPDVAGTISQAQVDDYCNKPSGYTSFGNACSVNEYFKIQSNGRLNFTNTVTAYVRMPKPKSYYDDGSAQNWGTAKAQELVATALDILVAQGFNFTTLSCDSSNTILSVNIFYAGTVTSGWSTGLWPHSWAIPTKTVDATNGITAYRYQMSDMGTSPHIGTFCHENGHMTCLFPDLYSYINNASIPGYYTLMAQGSWGGGDHSHPTNVDPYLKVKAGWADVVEVTAASHLRATAQADRNFYYKYTYPSNSQQYFLFENRDTSGYEGAYGGASAYCPGRGLVVWQVNEAGSNTNSTIQSGGTYATPYEAFVIEASPSASSPWYSAASPFANASDTFYSGFGANPLSDTSSPDLKFWDMTGFTGRTVASGLVLNSYSAQGPALSFTIGSGAVTDPAAIGLTMSQITTSCNPGQNASGQTFQVFNSGSGTLNYSISDDAGWLSCAPSSGSVSTGSQAVAVSFSTSGLASGTYTATITVTAPGATTKTIPVSLTVTPAPVLALTPTAISVAVLAPEIANTQYVAVANTGGGTMSYSVTKTASWLTPSITSGNCSTESDLVYLTLNPSGLSAGTYTDTVTVTAPGATNSPQTATVTFRVYTGLQLQTPAGGEQWFCGMTEPIRWKTSVAGTNVKIELLKGGALQSVIATSVANTGSYDWTVPGDVVPGTDYQVRISTIDALYSDTNALPLSISRTAYMADMTADPGWTLQGQWAWGTPTGAAVPYGNPDPTSGYTGTSVLGYNLAGAYANSIGSTYWATSPIINCSDFTGTRLSFYRRLGVETSSYDHAYIAVSNNGGTTWNTVWSNGTTTIDDSAWTRCEYDISAYADRKANVLIRFGMGATDSSWNYCGWNIDDIIVGGTYSPLDTTPPVASVVPPTDATRCATSLSLAFTASDGAGSGVASTRLYVKVPGAPAFVDTGLLRTGTSGTFTYSIGAGNGLYSFAARALDAAGNEQAAPSISQADYLVNTVENGAFTQSWPTGTGARVFPMTDDLDVTITLTGAGTNCSISVSRATGVCPAGQHPAYFRLPAQLLDESLTVTGNNLGLGWTAAMDWQYDTARAAGMGGAQIDSIWRFEGGQQPAVPAYSVSKVGNILKISGINGFSVWYAGNSAAVPVHVSHFAVE